MDKTTIIFPHKYTFNNILPDFLSVPETLFKRTLHLVMPSMPRNLAGYKIISKVYNYLTPQKGIFKRAVENWENVNRKTIIRAQKNQTTHKVIVRLPFQSLSLKEAIEKRYIIVNKKTVSISKTNPTKMDYLSLFKDLRAEVISTYFISLMNCAVSTSKICLTLDIKLGLATFYGFIKAFSKYLSGKYTLDVTPWKVIVEIFAETVTELCVHLSSRQFNPFELSAMKAFFRYNFENIANTYYNLLNTTTGSLEILKSGLKAFIKAYFYDLLKNDLLSGERLASILGGVISVGFINIFIDHYLVNCSG